MQDKLVEVCETANKVEKGEKEILASEEVIAKKMREIAKTIFGGETQFRLAKMLIGGRVVFADICVMLADKIYFSNDFYGHATTLRVTSEGKIIRAFQDVARARAYDLSTAGGEWESVGSYENTRAATDHEIAVNAPALAEELLNALKRRIDTLKTEKETLQKIQAAVQ